MYDWAEFRHFWYLLAILEKKGFRSASEHLHTSQPNLSVQARQFQEYASVTLFRKSKDGRIHPTEAGLAFISLARMVLETREDAINALIAIDRGEPKTLHLGCSSLVDQDVFRLFRAMHQELVPSCAIRSSHGDTTQLTDDLLTGRLDAAVVTLPVKNPHLRVESVRQDKLVVCLRSDHPLAERAAIHVSDLHDKLAVLYHPQRHPDAHAHFLELASRAGIRIADYSSASHPSEVQMLIKDGCGFALVREGTPLDEELTTRPVLGVSWTVDVGVIFNGERHPKTIPILIRKLRKTFLRTPDSPAHKKSAGSVSSPSREKAAIAGSLPFPDQFA
jgi:DNA-binding transcriptional LysR family regulator